MPAAPWTGAPVVGFCGRAGAGKTMAADYLGANHGFRRVRFVGPLKAMLMAHGCTEAEVDGADKERPSALLCGRTPRQAMQWHGTEWGRMLVGPDLWLRAWAHAADATLAACGRVVVDDVRFANEAQAIWDRGGLVVKITAGADPPPTHISEVIGFRWDAEIVNDPVRGLWPLNAAIEALKSCLPPSAQAARENEMSAGL